MKIDYEHTENIFKNSDKHWNKINLKLHKCSEETPNKPGAYIAYEQYDLDDQYLVTWTGKKWIHFESGGDICFGDKCREDHWSELPKLSGPRFIITPKQMFYQLQDQISTILHNFPENNNPLNSSEIISEKTELLFNEFKRSLNYDFDRDKK